ncbi:TRAF3-interacting protein 1-like [Hemiscyllium ocellatum]|uniref:TRAF3-interacting protein 1-like n=1 Tax=Hemiscyllium ocellatum TaxID=170820 RepID=UPI0029669CF9|nr:TRAF3-interacting protein 1-like [Hemiscyllium ocellatum]
MIQIKPVPVQASLTFYHHFYIALWSGSYISSAMEYAKYQMQNDTRFGRYWCNFVLLGLDTFVNLLDVKHDVLHQNMENAEEEVAQSSKQDWLNPATYTPPDQEALLLEMQKSLEELIVNQGSMSSVLKLLHLLMTEAIKRLSPTNRDNVTVKLTANIIGIPGVSSMLNLLGFRFQYLAPEPSKMGDRTSLMTCEQAGMGDVSSLSTVPISHAHPVAVIFPYWNPDRLLGIAQQAIAALIDLSACSQCVNALIWILPLTCERLEQLINLLEKCRSPPTVCPKLLEKEVASLWSQPHFRDFLQVIGYEQAGRYLFHNPRDLNKSLLLGSLNLFLALRPQQLQSLSKPDPQQHSSESLREQQSREVHQEAVTHRENQSREGQLETVTQREKQSRESQQETVTQREKQSREVHQEAVTQREKQSRESQLETVTQRETQSRESHQEGSVHTGGDKKTRQASQQSLLATRRDKKNKRISQESSTDTRRDKKTKQISQENVIHTSRDKKTRQGSLESSIDTRRDKKTRDSSQESSVDTGRVKKTRDSSQESLIDTGRDKKTRDGSQESLIDTGRDKKTRDSSQESLIDTRRVKKTRDNSQESLIDTGRDKKTRDGSQESLIDTGRDKKTRDGSQESLIDTGRDKKTREDSQESLIDTGRVKKTRDGSPKATSAKSKKNRQGHPETTATRNKRTKHGLQEASELSNKQSDQETQQTAKGATYPHEKSKVYLNTLKPLLVLRHQLMMQAPWLTVKPTSEEVRVKHDLVNRLDSLHSQQQAQLHRVRMWHKKALTELENKPEKQGVKRQVKDCCPKKVKVKEPRSPSTAQIPFDMSTATSQNVALRPSAHDIIKEQEENVRHRHRAAVKDIFLPFIEPLP